MQESIVFLVRVQCCCKESSRSLSHLLMSFLLSGVRLFVLLFAIINVLFILTSVKQLELT